MADQSLGGRYTAKRNADGTLDIFDVPIVSELEKGERADLPDFEITPQWLSGALKRATDRATRGYLPPIHVHHHDDGPPKARAGFFRVKRVGDYDLAGKPVKTLYADLLRIPPDVAEKILAGELPYRSIEILNVNSEPEVDSLALLDSQPPQFRYSLLSVGKMIEQTDAGTRLDPVSAHAMPTAAVAFRAFPNSAAAVLSRFPGSGTGEVKMAKDDDEKDEKKKKDEKLAAEAATFEEGAPAEAAPAWVAAMVKQIIDGVAAACGQLQAAKPPEPGDGSIVISPEADADDGIQRMDAEQLAAMKKDEEDAGAAKPKFIDPTTETALVARAVKAIESKFAGSLAESKGEIAGLKAALANRDKKDVEKDKAAKKVESLRAARAALRGAHVELTAEVESDLAAMADAGDEPLKRYVAGVVRSAPKDPESFEALSGSFSASNDPPELGEFQNSPAKLALGRELVKQFNGMAARGYAPRGVDLKRFIDMNRGAFSGAVD